MNIPRIIAPVLLCVVFGTPVQGFGQSQPTDGCGRYVRNSGRAELCGRVYDRVTGKGIGGGDARFVRTDGVEMNGPIREDGRFNLNVAAGHGTLTLSWSCRSGRKLVDTLTLIAGSGTRRGFAVSADAADSRCRISEDRHDTSASALQRWLQRGSCLQVSFGAWSPPLAAEYKIASTVQLDSSVLPASRQTKSHPFRDDLESAAWRFRGWMPLRGDSLEIVWSTGFSGITLTLGPSDSSLQGAGLWTFDVIVLDSLGFVETRGLPRAIASARSGRCENSVGGVR